LTPVPVGGRIGQEPGLEPETIAVKKEVKKTLDD